MANDAAGLRWRRIAPRKPAVVTGYALIITRIILKRAIALTACG